MVGVAGKSNACKTCKKRKVRCTGEKPFCSRCTTGGHICEGYERPRQFRHLSALDHDALLARSQPLTSLTELSRMLYGNFTVAEQNQHRLEALRRKDHDPDDPGNATSQVSVSARNSRNHQIPDGVQEALNDGVPMSWIQAIGPCRHRHSSLDLAMSALSLISLARNRGDERLHGEGVVKYGRVLKDLQEILATDSLALEEQTLASCMTLTIFEAMKPSGGNVCGWASHVEGISRLFQLRGPGLHVDKLSHHLFLGFRSTAIIHALALRRPTYLGEPDWLVIPWIRHAKTDFHYLLDVMSQIPIFIDQRERVRRGFGSDISIEMRSDLLQQGWDLHLQLKDWYEDLERRASDRLYIERPSSLTWPNAAPTDLEYGFSTFLDFQSFEIARMHLFYWTSLLLLYDNIITLMPDPARLGSAASSTDSTILRMPDKATVQSQALNVATLIAQSMEFLLSDERFFLSEEMHLRGVLNSLFPLRTAIHVFASARQHAAEAWCRSVFDGLALRGYTFGQILCGLAWDDIPVFLSGK